jgi:hypothetical protein
MANATYSESHEVDTATSLMYAMDLTPLVADCSLDIKELYWNILIICRKRSKENRRSGIAMKLIKCKDYNEVSAAAANITAAQIRKSPEVFWAFLPAQHPWNV